MNLCTRNLQKGLQRALSVFLVISALPAFGQLSLTDFNATGRGGVSTTFASDYQALGINPANLGIKKSFRDPRFVFGLMDTNFLLTTDALSRNELFNTMFNSSDITFTYQEKIEAANKFANTNVGTNFDAMIVGAGIRLPGNHGFAFSVRDRIQFFARMNRNAAEIAFLGGAAPYFEELILTSGNNIPNPLNPNNPNAEPLTEEQFERVISGQLEEVENDPDALTYSQLMDGTRVSASWYREYNIGYGTQLLNTYDVDIYLGVGARYVQGFMLLDFEASGGELPKSYISSSPTFGLDFPADTEFGNPSFQGSRDAGPIGYLFPESVGNGYGFDIGGTIIIRDNLHLGIALNNIGQIKWDGNVYELRDGVLAQATGLGYNNYNIFAGQAGAFSLAGENSAFSDDYSGVASQTVALPGTLRFGASYKFFRMFHVGLDAVFPTNNEAGNLEKPLYALGGDFRPSRIFRISTGVNYGGNTESKVNIPIGITYLARRGFYEAGVATTDIGTLIGDISQGSTVSLAFGFIRIKLL